MAPPALPPASPRSPAPQADHLNSPPRLQRHNLRGRRVIPNQAGPEAGAGRNLIHLLVRVVHHPGTPEPANNLLWRANPQMRRNLLPVFSAVLESN